MLFALASKDALKKKLPNVIFVEGQDDAWFLNKLLEEMNADPLEIGIVYMNGDGALKKEVDQITKSAAYVSRATRSIGFVLDADGSVEGRMKALHAILAARGLPTPGHGKVLQYDKNRRLGVFIFPNGADPGELEDLLLATVAADERLQIVKDALMKVEAKHATLSKRSKRIARMYMSVLPIEPCGIGRGYCEGVFDGNHQYVIAMKNFLEAISQDLP